MEQMEQNDAQLIQRILQGDPDAFTPLVKKYQKGVHTLVWRKIGDFHIAQEITQDTFLKAYQKLGTLKNPNQFPGWLYVIAANLANDYLRKNRLPMESLDADNTNEVDKVSYSKYQADKQAEEADENRREIVKKLLRKLPESERTVMMMHYLGEMTIKSISEFLGVSQNTIKSRLSRARNRLQKEEDVLQQNLGSFQLPDQLTENIMREVSHLSPVPAPPSKPMAPLALSAASAVLIFLLIGTGTQYLSRFQKPYNLNATSEPTVEIIDAVFVLDSPAKPAVRTQAGSSVLPGKGPGAGQKPDESLFATLPVDTIEVSTPKPQWTQTGGPEGGRVQNLFIASNGDAYAGTGTDLYRLVDDRSRWGIVNANMPFNGSWHMTERNDTLYVVSDTEVLTSIDRGETWNPLGTRPEGQLIDLVIIDEVFYLALTDGIFRSVDTGKSWASVSEQLVNKEIRAITAIENVVFVGTDSGLYRLNSESCTLLSVGESQNIRAMVSAGYRLYVAVGEKAVRQIFDGFLAPKMTMATSLALYRSTDLGDSWQTLDFRKTEVEPSLQDGMHIRIEGLSESDQNGEGEPKDSETKQTAAFKMVAVEETLFVLDDKNSYYSSDAGETWITLDSHVPNDVSKLVSSNANTFYRNTQSGISRTTDAGKTWYPFTTGLVKTSVMNLVSVRNVLYANVGGGILISSNGGESWTPVSNRFGNIMNLTKSNDMLYARGIEETEPRLFRLSTEDNRLIPIPEMPVLSNELDYIALMGEHMEEALLAAGEAKGEENPFKDIAAGEATGEESPIDADTLVEDYGQIIEETLAKLMRGLVGSVAVSDNTYYMEYQSKLFRWKLGAPEWIDTGLVNEDASFNGLEAQNANLINPAVLGKTIYVAKLDGHLFQSFDEGDTWTDVTEELPFSFTYFKAIAFAGSAIYVATDRGVVYSNDGIHWQTATDPEGTSIVIERFAVDGTMLYGTSEQRVYQLKEGSGVWQQVTPEIPMPITSLAVERNVLYVGTRGSGVLRFTLDEKYRR